MSSIRCPKRLTIRGDDEKEHMFLVKGGEDLRLDQRIEQVIKEINIFNYKSHASHDWLRL
jgi:DNA-dependent protein kinase catalytic subunit